MVLLERIVIDGRASCLELLERAPGQVAVRRTIFVPEEQAAALAGQVTPLAGTGGPGGHAVYEFDTGPPGEPCGDAPLVLPAVASRFLDVFRPLYEEASRHGPVDPEEIARITRDLVLDGR